eukprot:824476-Pleurochrysis_carterae.AAC.8
MRLLVHIIGHPLVFEAAADFSRRLSPRKIRFSCRVWWSKRLTESSVFSVEALNRARARAVISEGIVSTFANFNPSTPSSRQTSCMTVLDRMDPVTRTLPSEQVAAISIRTSDAFPSAAGSASAKRHRWFPSKARRTNTFEHDSLMSKEMLRVGPKPEGMYSTGRMRSASAISFFPCSRLARRRTR